MPTTYTPLRYPGGKSALYPWVSALIKSSCGSKITYTEPFAGGAGLAIKLLLKNDVDRIHLNDIDPAINLFWRSILEDTEDFCARLAKTPITPEEWAHQREIFLRQDTSDETVFAFAAFYLNRTNISGVLKGGMIGGKNQSGNFKLDARFNKVTLERKIRIIAEQKSRITVSGWDACEMLTGHLYSDDAFLNIDPPYVHRGPELYRDFYTAQDHLDLREAISSVQEPWILTYDDSPLIRDAYASFALSPLDIFYSMGKVRRAQELVFFSPNLQQISPSKLEPPYASH